MRIVRDAEDLPNLFHAAFTEAANAFGNGELYMEKYIEAPRHIEFQVLADEHGNVVSLFERECSIQRRHQKLIEEAPSLQITPKLREELGRMLCHCMDEIGYQNAGTVEFLMDSSHQLYFIEMNTRIQVEHPVTEAITGVDIVKAQLRIAAGEKLDAILPRKLEIRGHAIECRINAEDPFDDFRPSPGRLEMYYQPGGRGVRVDTHAYAGYTIPPTYDSMIGKLITYGKDRREAIDRMSRALGEYMVTGIKTTISFQQAIMQDPNFRRGVYSTAFVEQLLGGARRELIEEKT
jgi:acetyl-CoA carboxylase biotin carboxylase subunit